MKKILPFAVLTLFLFIQSCTNDEAVSGSSSDFCTIEIPCEDPVGLITVEDANVMEEDYKNNFYNILNETMGFGYPDYEGAGRYVWFDLEEIKKYVAYVEQNAEANGQDGKLGLRVYLGSKMQNNSTTGNPEPRQTVFFVPTVNPTGGSDFSDNINITSMKRLNLGGAGMPDDMDQETGN